MTGQTKPPNNSMQRTALRDAADATFSEYVINDERLAQVVRRLIEAYQPERIYLFGSKARGDAGPDSGPAPQN
jgi:predicted nucleotidyltransferase